MAYNYLNYQKCAPLQPVLVQNAQQNLIYNPGGDSTFLDIQVKLVETFWKKVLGPVHNRSEEVAVRKATWSTSFSATHNKEKGLKADLEFALKGLNFTFGGEHKVISGHEVSRQEQVEKEYRVAPGKSLYVYQRCFKYRQEWLWRVETGGSQYRAVGTNSTPFTLHFEIIEETDEELIREEELSGSCNLEVKGIPPRSDIASLWTKHIDHFPAGSRNAIQRQHAEYRELRINR